MAPNASRRGQLRLRLCVVSGFPGLLGVALEKRVLGALRTTTGVLKMGLRFLSAEAEPAGECDGNEQQCADGPEEPPATCRIFELVVRWVDVRHRRPSAGNTVSMISNRDQR